jgi:hypothetical protein
MSLHVLGIVFVPRYICRLLRVIGASFVRLAWLSERVEHKAISRDAGNRGVCMLLAPERIGPAIRSHLRMTVRTNATDDPERVIHKRHNYE